MKRRCRKEKAELGDRAAAAGDHRDLRHRVGTVGPVVLIGDLDGGDQRGGGRDRDVGLDQEQGLAALGAAVKFQVIRRRYEKGSIILTTNRGIASWGEIFAADGSRRSQRWLEGWGILVPLDRAALGLSEGNPAGGQKDSAFALLTP